MNYEIKETDSTKVLISPDVNYIFSKRTGFTALWGATKDEDPDWCPYGPVIADIEITTRCNGPGGTLCPFCYKANTNAGQYMHYSTFTRLFQKLPDTITQIAFGVDAQATTNPDIYDIFDFCRRKGVIPNVTVADITEGKAKYLAYYCGAVAVSRYENKEYCYNSVSYLTGWGMDQVNIHQMLSEETFDQAMETIGDIQTDGRLQGLNAIVFLSLKQKGRGKAFHNLSDEKFKQIVDTCLDRGISFGFDSCSAIKFLKAIEGRDDYNRLKMMTEPCESARFSIYINVEGKYFPCSFTENGEGVNVLEVDNFMDIWRSDANRRFREKSLECIDNNISCQEFMI